MESLTFRLLGSASQQASPTGQPKIGQNGDAGQPPSPSTAGSLLQNFGETLKNQLNTLNDVQAQANEAQQTYATGGDIELHNVMIATEKAELSLQLAMQIRNKAVAAYQEISHMSV